ncbi:hypothetical protein OCB16_03285 [Bacillus cereus]|nr:hypothetical protein [Bacillus cereus]
MIQLHEFTHYKYLADKHQQATTQKSEQEALSYLRLYEVKLAKKYGKEVVHSLIEHYNK